MMKTAKNKVRRTLATILAIAVVMAGITVTPKEASAAKYEYTYSSGIPARTAEIVDGVVTYTVGGNSYTLTLRLTAADTACDQYGTCWILYKNGALYWASYETEGTSLVKHRLYSGSSAVYATKLLFKGSSSTIATHYEYNGVEYPLPTLEELKATLNGGGSQTETPVQTPTVVPTVAPVVVPTVAPTDKDSTTTTTVTKVTFDMWWQEFLNGNITWEEFAKRVGEYNWNTKADWEETSTTYYVYNPDGTIAYTTTVTTGTGKETGNGTSTSTETSTGSAKVEATITGTGGGTASATSTSITTNSSNTKSSTKKNTKKRHVKISGKKIVYLNKNNKTVAIALLKKNGKFKLQSIRGSKVSAGVWIEKTKTFLLRKRNGDLYAIDFKTLKVKKLKGKGYRFCRNKRNFGIAVIMKNGQKKNIKNLKVTTGKFRKKI